MNIRFCFLVALAPTLASAAQPQVDSVSGSRLDDGLIRVDYVLSGAPAVIAFDVQTNGTSIGSAHLRRLVGDVNRRCETGPHFFFWAADDDWPHGVSVSSLSLVVRAHPMGATPAYMAVDLVQTGDVRYYSDEAALPFPVTNAVWKRTSLLLRRVPAQGLTYVMGSPADEVGRYGATENRHLVTLSRDFYLGVYPLTESQYYNMTGFASFNKRNSTLDTDVCPMENVSYETFRGSVATDRVDWPTTGRETVGATSHLKLIRDKYGLDFDLPTSAEWEFACRAGTTTALYNGQNLESADGENPALEEIGWYNKSPTNRIGVASTIRAVGLKKPNAWGFHDMLGNCWEICIDWYPAEPYADETDPKGPVSNDSSCRVMRGGCYYLAASQCRSARFSNRDSTTVHEAAGFRLWYGGGCDVNPEATHVRTYELSPAESPKIGRAHAQMALPAFDSCDFCKGMGTIDRLNTFEPEGLMLIVR